MSRVAIVGGGLAGALIATYLGRAGFEVDVFERRPDPRGREGSEGRSINLAISTRGIHALAGVDVDQRVLETAVPMRGRMMHAPSGALAFQPYGTERSQAINSVSRAGLNRELIEAADRYDGVRLHFGVRCEQADLDEGRLSISDRATGEQRTVEADAIIGADGAFSVVRGAMHRRDRFTYSQSYLDHGYKELTIPPARDGGFAMAPNALHIWPRGGFMMIALPNKDGSFTCTLFWPFEGDNSFANLKTPVDVERFFGDVFPDAVPMMPTLVDDYFQNPTSSLVTVRCWPWHTGKGVLIGDACHAVVPFYGQGANAAFEDCGVFAECLDEIGADWGRLFRVFEERRKQHVDALADLAIANFLEMRDHVASRTFRIRKQAEKALHRVLPFWFVPLYSLITFSRVPYADARAKAERQARVVRFVVGALVVLLGAALLVTATGGP